VKVIHLATSSNGGAGTAMLRTNNALLQLGIDSNILTRNGTYYSCETGLSPSSISFEKRIKSSAVTLLQSKFVQNSSDLVTPVSVETIDWNSSVLNDFDIIHIHATYNFINHSSLEKLGAKGKPIFFTLHDQRLFTGGCHYSRICSNYEDACSNCPQVTKFAQKLVYKSFQTQKELMHSNFKIHLLTPSTWLATKVKNAAITKSLPVHVVRNPIPDLYFEVPLKTPKNQKERVRIGFIADQLQNPYKGIEVIAKAVNSLAPIYSEKISIVFIGNGEIPDISSGIPTERIQAHNDLEMTQLLRAIDILVVPSSQDNSPSVIGEALAMGVTVIGSDAGGIPEILSSFSMPIFRVDDWKYLADLIRETSKLHYDGNQIRKKAFSIFSGKNHAEILENLYLNGLRNE